MEKRYGNLISKINQLNEQIEAERVVQIKGKLDKSGKKLQSHIHELLSSTCTETSSQVDNRSSEVPQLGVENALCVLNGFSPGSADKDFANMHEAVFPESTKLSKIQRIPPYTTWIFLDKNQRMAEDQSVVGRRRIYYDQSGNEALVCTDSDDDIADVEDERREFSKGEDRILWMAFEEHGVNEDVANVVSHFIGGTPSELLERYNELKLKSEVSHAQGSTERNVLLEKTLSAALDSFDNLFCRRCLVFDCRLHGCSQSPNYSSEKTSSWSEAEDRKPCSHECYLLMEHGIGQGKNRASDALSLQEKIGSDGSGMICSLGSDAGKASDGGVLSAATTESISQHTTVRKRRNAVVNVEELERADAFKDSFDKKQKRIRTVEAVTLTGEKGVATSTSDDITSQVISIPQSNDIVRDEVCDTNRRLQLEQSATFLGGQRDILFSTCTWKPLEKDLYMKGLEIFGRNSCLITRNLLSGLKSCTEVFNYMHNNGASTNHKKDVVGCPEDHATADSDYMEQDILTRPRSRLFRKRGKTRRLKYSSKSNGHPSSWKRFSDGDQPLKQYTPCTCQFMCGKDCSCLKIGTCCEKYCGCSKSCKNRFRGCHCAKSQCRSRQCPCFAANRECDPDVCRNCWVSCGGDSLGEPPKKGDGQCGNMRILLRQQQRILLARSDVAGWGAFIKNSVNKHDYLGEYTGELISHREADKRGKIYDRANSSFLFDLNDQYVLDACRQGDKLKFANHSSKPNCYCKIMLVAGDHRVGIFAKERIESKEELFYDYRYGPDQQPAWARKPESSKKDDSLLSRGRARKHQSR